MKHQKEILDNHNNILLNIRRKEIRRWTDEEDKKLIEAIDLFGPSNWTSVAKFVGNNRNRSQCSQRYKRDICPSIKREKWTTEEDEQLFRLIDKFGTHSWTRIAREIGCRTDVQCRFRYKNTEKKKIEKADSIDSFEEVFGDLSAQLERICNSNFLWEDIAP